MEQPNAATANPISGPNELSVLLDQILERANKATPGPWRFCRDKWDAKEGIWFLVSGREGKETSVLPGIQAHSDLPQRPDSIFIASSRTDVPALVKALRKAVKSFEATGPHDWAKETLAEVTAILTQAKQGKE